MTTTPDMNVRSNEALVKFDFHGDALDVVQDAASIGVGIKSVCAALGLANQPQQRKLSSTEWATVTMKMTVAADGKQREMAFIDLDGLPMWLATIDPGRVNPLLRPRLIHYQRECARVLRDHFFGRRDAAPLPDVEAMVARAVAAAMAQYGHEPVALPAHNPRSELAVIAVEDARELRRRMSHVAHVTGYSFSAIHGYVRSMTRRASYKRVTLGEFHAAMAHLQAILDGTLTLNLSSPRKQADDLFSTKH